MITFPVEDSFPLGDVPKFVEDHFGIDFASTPDRTVMRYHCKMCEKYFNDKVDYEEHECKHTT